MLYQNLYMYWTVMQKEQTTGDIGIPNVDVASNSLFKAHENVLFELEFIMKIHEDQQNWNHQNGTPGKILVREGCFRGIHGFSSRGYCGGSTAK